MQMSRNRFFVLTFEGSSLFLHCLEFLGRNASSLYKDSLDFTKSYEFISTFCWVTKQVQNIACHDPRSGRSDNSIQLSPFTNWDSKIIPSLKISLKIADYNNSIVFFNSRQCSSIFLIHLFFTLSTLLFDFLFILKRLNSNNLEKWKYSNL